MEGYKATLKRHTYAVENVKYHRLLKLANPYFQYNFQELREEMKGKQGN